MRKCILTLVVLGTTLLTLSTSRAVLGHADFDHSEPAAGAVLDETPASVRIWFTQELFRRAGMNSIEVYDADGQRVDQDDAAIDDDDRSLMRVSLAPELPAGVYTVRWHTLSADDGHEGDGEFTFSVGDAAGYATAADTPVAATAPVEATPTSGSPPTTDEPSTPEPTAIPASRSGNFACPGGALPLVLVLGVVWIRRQRSG